MSIVEQTAGEELLAKVEELAERVTSLQYDLQPELLQRFGASGRMRTKQDTMYHLRYLSQSVSVGSPMLFVQYISWLKILLARYGITGEDLRLNLELIREEIYREFRPPSRETLLGHLDMGMDRLEGAEESATFLNPSDPYHEEAARYLELLLASERRQASQLVTGLMESGVPIRDLYMHIFQVSQHEIGRLWQTGAITVAQEHYCTAVTQSIISSLYPYWLKAPEEDKPRLVAAGVGQELHEIGLRMLTDFFEMEGWSTYYLGANVPISALVDCIKEQKADMVALSVTMSFHVERVKEAIDAIRGDEEIAGVHIIVGGLPFNIDRELWIRVGADGYAPNATTAIEMAERLLKTAR